ncbi:lipase (class 2) [Nocardia tenerifensis]|uniref:Lipase (Class 2) n=1 Tax=Nocardia tenerifensis TaxID=228006 RepID=A0A318K5Q9_9NOCA|nr:alpha/beta fold hydrolase [Nocardia tenerifensis]PXX68678.1 lipase (class 2) [Nocardia tenerifensis]
MGTRWHTRLLAVVAAAGVLSGACATTAQARPGESRTAAGDVTDQPGTGKDPDGSIPPRGSNDWACLPTPAHPRPVVLVHGTWGNQNDWNVLAPQLKAEGYCVFSLNYGRDTASVLGALPGIYGVGDIHTSAGELAVFVDRVRAATGSAKVDLIGHSQGALMSRQYLRFAGGADKVDRLISLAGTNHGSTMRGVANRLPSGSAYTGFAAGLTGIAGVAAAQQLVGSDFLRELNAAGDTEPGVAYTVIASTRDDASTPPEATFLQAGPDATVDNVWVQDFCATDTFDHGTLPQSPTVAYIVEQALDPSYTGTACPEHTTGR